MSEYRHLVSQEQIFLLTGAICAVEAGSELRMKVVEFVLKLCTLVRQGALAPGHVAATIEKHRHQLAPVRHQRG